MEQWVSSQREVARQLGFKSHRAVQKAIESGRIPEGAVRRDDAGKISAIEVNAARESLAANTDPMHSQRDERGDLVAGAGGSGGAAGGSGALNFGNRGKGSALLQARAKEKFYAANLRELEYLKQAGALTSAAGVKKAAAETARSLRNAMLAIPDRIAPVLDPGNPGRAHKLLTDEIQKALREFSSELEQRAAAAARADEREPALL